MGVKWQGAGRRAVSGRGSRRSDPWLVLDESGGGIQDGGHRSSSGPGKEQGRQASTWMGCGNM